MKASRLSDEGRVQCVVGVSRWTRADSASLARRKDAGRTFAAQSSERTTYAPTTLSNRPMTITPIRNSGVRKTPQLIVTGVQ
jgi:hypothetical protein